MKKITIIGLGKVGTLIALLLQSTKKYHLQLIDRNFNGTDAERLFKLYPTLKNDAKTLDITQLEKLEETLNTFQTTAVVSCLPFFLTKNVADAAYNLQCHYFDLTEDVATTAYIKELAESAGKAFVPQCGLAPGMVGIIANDLMQHFTEVYSCELRVGALPQFTNHGLKYALTWSTEGLINEYDKPSRAIIDRKTMTVLSLEGLESLEILGEDYEAFNTSGGLGSLVDLYQDKLNSLNYKTIRYPGHCEKMKFLLQDLKLREDKVLLKSILEKATPRSYQDKVLLAIQAIGIKDGELQSKYYIKKILPREIEGYEWSALQVSTASGLCAVLDVVLHSNNKYQGFVYQETIKLDDILKTPFGIYY